MSKWPLLTKIRPEFRNKNRTMVSFGPTRDNALDYESTGLPMIFFGDIDSRILHHTTHIAFTHDLLTTKGWLTQEYKPFWLIEVKWIQALRKELNLEGKIFIFLPALVPGDLGLIKPDYA